MKIKLNYSCQNFAHCTLSINGIIYFFTSSASRIGIIPDGWFKGGFYTRIIKNDFPNYISTFLSRNTCVVYSHYYKLNLCFLSQKLSDRRLRSTSLEYTLESYLNSNTYKIYIRFLRSTKDFKICQFNHFGFF